MARSGGFGTYSKDPRPGDHTTAPKSVATRSTPLLLRSPLSWKVAPRRLSKFVPRKPPARAEGIPQAPAIPAATARMPVKRQPQIDAAWPNRVTLPRVSHGGCESSIKQSQMGANPSNRGEGRGIIDSPAPLILDLFGDPGSSPLQGWKPFSNTAGRRASISSAVRTWHLLSPSTLAWRTSRRATMRRWGRSQEGKGQSKK